jgi:predicted nucleotidyltransferase
VSLLIEPHAGLLPAVILFCSVARHEERPPDDACPSDVDLLAIFDTTDRLVRPYQEYIFATFIDAYALHLDAPREVNVLLSDRTMRTWDSMFLDKLARDGILLYARGSLPAPLAARPSFQRVLEDKGVRR